MKKLLRARIFTFLRIPSSSTDTEAFNFFEDGYLLIENQKILEIGNFYEYKSNHNDFEVTDYRPCLIIPGFIDTHNHFPQLKVIASFGTQLLDWLKNYTFPEEAKYSNLEYCKIAAKNFLRTLFDHGTTTSVSFGSVHKDSINSIFEEASKHNMCLIAGKVMMDRNAPKSVLDTPQTSYDHTKALIEKWHGKDRLKYAISPRFCITSTESQLELAGILKREFDKCYLQTHLSENKDEISYTMSLFPGHKSYLDIYDHYGLLGSKSLMGHAIYLNENDVYKMVATETVAVHCPTSNLFLGSGLFDLKSYNSKGMRTAIATDIGGGTSFSMLKTLDAAYKIQQLKGNTLDPLSSLYWATLGNASSLGLQDEIGRLGVGCFADLVVLDSKATLLSEERVKACNSITEELFVIQTLGDDRFVKAVYVAGSKVK